MGLTDDRRGRPGPGRGVELKPERYVERQAHRRPQPQPEQQRRAPGLERAGCVIYPARDRAGLGGRCFSAGH